MCKYWYPNCYLHPVPIPGRLWLSSFCWIVSWNLRHLVVVVVVGCGCCLIHGFSNTLVGKKPLARLRKFQKQNSPWFSTNFGWILRPWVIRDNLPQEGYTFSKPFWSFVSFYYLFFEKFLQVLKPQHLYV